MSSSRYSLTGLSVIQDDTDVPTAEDLAALDISMRSLQSQVSFAQEEIKQLLASTPHVSLI
jgi:hypothetical protein